MLCLFLENIQPAQAMENIKMDNTSSEIDLGLLSGDFDGTDVSPTSLATTTDILPKTTEISPPTSPSLAPTIKRKRSRLLESQEFDREDFLPDVPTPANSNAKLNYLITWTDADTALMDREQFGRFICRHFEQLEEEKGQLIAKWAVSCELHLQTRGCHYHMSLNLKQQRRWSQVAKNIRKAGVQRVDFKSYGTTYASIFDYVQKYDAHIVMSPGHEGLVNSVNAKRTNNAIRARKRGGKSRGGGASRGGATSDPKKTKCATEKKEARMDMHTLHDMIIANNIRTDEELASLAKAAANDGKRDLQLWLMKHPSSKTRNDILNTAWLMEDSTAKIQRRNQSNISILEEFLTAAHTFNKKGVQCTGDWLNAALDILQKNNLDRTQFTQKIISALVNGRGKGYNLMINGPTNSGKSFILMPLTLIYNCFWQPSAGSYNWVAAPGRELIFLNDIRYDEDGDKKVMAWRQFLNLLEGCTVNIARPSNLFSEDYEWKDRKAPIFATAEYPISRVVAGRVIAGETQQMNQRWVFVKFHHQYLGEDVNYDLEACPRCFAEFVLMTEDVIDPDLGDY